MHRTLLASALATALVACSSNPGDGGDGGDHHTGDGGMDANANHDGGGDGTSGGDGSGGGDASGGDGSHNSLCPSGSLTRLVGTVHAPNGTDPIPGVYVYLTQDTQTFPAAPDQVTCQHCMQSPSALMVAQSRGDGSFEFENSLLDTGGTYTVVVEIGGFRHVERHVTVTPCTTNTLTADQTKLPGASSGDDTIPRIAVAGYRTSGTSGDTNDHFPTVLDAIGITGYDTFDPDKAGHNGGTGPDLLGLLADSAQLSRYQILITPCGSLGNFRVIPHLTPQIVSNVSAWLAAGGRLYDSDLAYAIVDQAAHGAITFATGAAASGDDPADIGVGIASGTSLAAHLDYAPLRDWLQTVGAIPAGSDTLPVYDLRDPWAAIDSVPSGELVGAGGNPPAGVVMVSGDVSWHATPPGPAHHPLTVQVDVPGPAGDYCGRVVFTSYHVQVSSSGSHTLTAQERVLEYLFFQLSTCIQAPG